MIKITNRDRSQRGLYFQLSSALNEALYDTKRVPAVYAIYKDETCFYVGQSQNVASRLATHLSGKFKNATKVLVFIDVDECGIEALLETEKYLIRELDPIENILVDNDEAIDGTKLFGVIHDINKKAPAEITNVANMVIFPSNYQLVFLSNEAHLSIYESSLEAIDTLEAIIKDSRYPKGGVK